MNSFHFLDLEVGVGMNPGSKQEECRKQLTPFSHIMETISHINHAALLRGETLEDG
jgi:hypothetical protein